MNTSFAPVGVDKSYRVIISEDPILKPGNPDIPFLLPRLLMSPAILNAYNYTGNNPVNYTDPAGLIWPIDCGRCFYYMSQCAKKGLKCKETKCNQKEDVTSDELFNDCYKGIPECQKQLEFCGKCGLAPKGTPTPPSQ